ncbi:MAG TPA: glycosyltransferase family 4 protein [Longimicrobiaceae bacterium]|nr:glycosyltransferase family 4 protein [Longimicrobiaceae bacterium]
MSGPIGLRVIAIGHSFVVRSNRARWERLAERHPDTDVTLVAPATFRTDRYGAEQAFRVATEERRNYRVLPIATTDRGLYRSITLGIRRHRPHVIQVNEEPTEWSVLQSFLAAQLFAPRAVRLFYYYTNILSPPDTWYRRAKIGAVFRMAGAAFAGSTDSEGVLRDLGFVGPVHIQTEIGADEHLWTSSSTRQNGGPFTVGFVGSLTPQKGVADLARAVLALRGDWRLVVVGDGPERDSVRTILAAGGHEGRLDLKGLVERDALPSLVREFDVLVLPSRTMPPLREQFGLVLAEAMLSGVAVIGSDSGAIPEVIGEGGLIFPEGNHRALATQLQLLRDRPDHRRELARRGRDRALRLYSATALADQTYNLYRQLVEEKAGR